MTHLGKGHKKMWPKPKMLRSQPFALVSCGHYNVLFAYSSTVDDGGVGGVGGVTAAVFGFTELVKCFSTAQK